MRVRIPNVRNIIGSLVKTESQRCAGFVLAAIQVEDLFLGPSSPHDTNSYNFICPDFCPPDLVNYHEIALLSAFDFE